MMRLLAETEPVEWPMLLIGWPFVLGAIWAGVRCWQGRWPGPFGPRPTYQTYYGAAYLAVGAGVGSGLLVAGESLRGLLGSSRSSALYWIFSIAAVVVLAGTGALTLAYFWTGVPPRLRPSYQRDPQRRPPRHDTRHDEW